MKWYRWLGEWVAYLLVAALVIFLLHIAPVMAQQQQLYCQNSGASGAIPCSTLGPPVQSGSNDPGWLAYGKINAMMGQIFGGTFGFNQLTTGNYYAPAARIDRFNDRVFIGKATLGNGLNPAGYSGLPSWVGATYLFRDTQLGAISSLGLFGITAASHTSDMTTGLQQSTSAFGGYLVNDYAGIGNTYGRVSYFEVQHTSTNAAAESVGLEYVVKDESGVTNTITPYGGTRLGTIANTFSCGGDPSYGGTATTNCNGVMFVARSTGSSFPWNKGFVFTNNSLAGSTGASGGGNAAATMEMAYGQGLNWYCSTGTFLCGRLSSLGTSGSNQYIEQDWGNSLVQWNGIDAGTQVDTAFSITHVTTGANSLAVTDAVAGSSPQLQAVGSDSTINLTLVPKGSAGYVSVSNGAGQQISSATPVETLFATGAATDTKNTLIRLNSGGAFAISSASDAAPTTNVNNLLSATRSGTTWSGPLTVSQGIASSGTKFTTSGCSVSATTGGAAAGTFTLGANTCTVVITINGATGSSSTNGWTCQAHDRTAPTVLIGGESASTNTTASITIPAGAGATDVISFSCTGF